MSEPGVHAASGPGDEASLTPEEHRDEANSTLRQQRDVLESEIRRLRARISSLEQRLARRRRSVGVEAGDRIQQQALASLESARRALKDKQRAYAGLVAELDAFGGQLEIPEEPILAPSAPHPLLLFPVRLETRFMDDENDQPALYVRIYPDQVSLDIHNPQLTADEVRAGRLYQERIATAESTGSEESGAEESEETKRLAWRELAGQVGPSRAAWILETLPPYGEGVDESKLARESTFETPRVRVMPDRFLVQLYRGDKCVRWKFGKAIPDPLPVLWDLTAAESEEEDEAGARGGGDAVESEEEDEAGTDFLSRFDEGSRWIIDLDAALEAGLAVKISLDRMDLDRGFSRVIAVGLKNVDPTTGAQLVEELLDAHHYTDGVAFLPYQTPTNNTLEAPSGYSSSWRDLDAAYDVECCPQPFEDWHRSDAGRLATALGIDRSRDAEEAADETQPASVFSQIAHANDDESSYAQEMLDALWPATWGYYLEALLGLDPTAGLEALLELDPTASLLTPFRKHLQFVNARGPLATLRVGNLPYGILPVSTVREWQPSPSDWSWTDEDESLQSQWADVDGQLHDILLKLFHHFQYLAGDPQTVPRVGASDDPDLELLQILGMEPAAVSHSLRQLVDEDFVNQLLWFSAPVFFGSYTWADQWVQIWQEELEANALFLEKVTGLGTISEPGNASPPILRWFLWGLSSALSWPLAEASPEDALSIPVEDGDFSWPVSGLLRRFIECGSVRARDPKRLVDALQRLEDRFLPDNVDALDSLFRDCLDLFTHRLDAWITSLATRRLHAIRQLPDRKHGVYLGAFGWVEDLRPRWAENGGGQPSSENPLDITPAEGGATTLVGSPLGGYIHAPSVGQAAAAAVLRSAYFSHAEDRMPEVAKVNLSSERVRLALRLLDEVRQGQPPGAVLGYQFERGLHDRSLDRYIDTFRGIFPLKAGKETPLATDETGETVETVETVSARNVVDGLALATAWRGRQTGEPSPILDDLRSEEPALAQELDRLPEALDAVSDLWFAEAIFQGTQGRYERMAAALDAAAGAGPIPEVEFVRTPRGGHSDTHRVCLLFNSRVDGKGGAPTDGYSRATAEPLLNDWVGRILGDMRTIRCRAWVPSRAGSTRTVSLADLGLSPLDFVYMAATPPGGEETELEQLIRYHVRVTHDPPLGANVDVEIDLGRPDADAGPSRSMAEASEVARGLLQVIGNATPLRPSLLCLPEEARTTADAGLEDGEEPQQVGVYDATDYEQLRARVQAARARFDHLYKDLQKVLAYLDTDGVRTEGMANGALALLKRARDLGLPGTVPQTTPGDDLNKHGQELEGRIRTTHQEVARRKKKAEQRLAEAAAAFQRTDLDMAIRELVAVTKALFGDAFTMLPTFGAPRPRELQRALNQDILGEKGTDRIWLWLQQAAQTHPRLRRFETALILAEAWRSNPILEEPADGEIAGTVFGAAPPLELRVAQLPFRTGDRWTALAKSEWGRLTPEERAALEARPQGCVSLALLAPPPLHVLGGRVAGILVDEWEERIPSREQATGVSFHYDQPNAQAPQAILLAVPGQWSEGSGPWRLEDVARIVYDTMDLCRVRAVDLDAFQRLGQFLPALYLPKEIVKWDANHEEVYIDREITSWEEE